MAYVPAVKTASGATAVQIVWSSRRGSRKIERIGSAHDDAELEALKAVARQRLASGQAEFVRCPPPQDGYASGLLQPPAAPGSLRTQQTITAIHQDNRSAPEACRVRCVQERTPRARQHKIAGTVRCEGTGCGGGNVNDTATVDLSQYITGINQPATPGATAPVAVNPVKGPDIPETAAGGSSNIGGGSGTPPPTSNGACEPGDNGEVNGGLGDLVSVGANDPSTIGLAERIGGVPSVRYANDAKGREFRCGKR